MGVNQVSQPRIFFKNFLGTGPQEVISKLSTQVDIQNAFLNFTLIILLPLHIKIVLLSAYVS